MKPCFIAVMTYWNVENTAHCDLEQMADQTNGTLQLKLPHGMTRQHAMNALNEGVAKSFTILQAMAAEGYEVAKDQVRDRRKGYQ